MLTCLLHDSPKLHTITAKNHALLKNAVWIDLLAPTKEEEIFVEQYVKINIPTREEMAQIELSNRLYQQNGNIFMTAPVIAHSSSPIPKFDPVTCVLMKNVLVTIRYIDPMAFQLLGAEIEKLDKQHRNPISIFLELLAATINRLADTLELVAENLETYSNTIFKPETLVDKRLNYERLMQQIGGNTDINSKVRESLVAFNRLVLFFTQMADDRLDNVMHSRLTSFGQDITALSDHANFISTKVNFLLDATLGKISIEQNNIIKIFSIAAVISLPPTLVASIYGMNFAYMPELTWSYGYAAALGMMLVSALVPYLFFKYKRWL